MPESFIKVLYQGYEAKEKGNLQKAFQLFQKAIELESSSPIAAFELALFYEEGVLVPVDLDRAFQLYSQAAEGYVALAQAKLADWYEKGICVEANADLATHWRNLANERLDEQAFTTSLLNGYTAKDKGDKNEALACFQRALELKPDTPGANYELGLFYEEGDVLPQNLEIAFGLFQKAAQAASASAQFKLADWYEKGIYVPKDSDAAKVWKERAIQQQEIDEEPPLSLAESIRKKIAEMQDQ